MNRPRKTLAQVLAYNIEYFMQKAQIRSANELAGKAKISPNTVRNYLDPKKRTVTATKHDGSPTLDKLEKIALALNCKPWELLHANIEVSIANRRTIKQWTKFLKAADASGGRETADIYDEEP